MEKPRSVFPGKGFFVKKGGKRIPDMLNPKETASIYEIIQAQLLAKLRDAIESEEPFTWIKPWKGAPYPCSYENPKRPFGAAVNFLFLETGEYLTFSQIRKLQEENPEVRIKKGAKAVYVYTHFPIFEKRTDGSLKLDGKGEPILKRFGIRYVKEYHISDVVHAKSHFVESDFIHEETAQMALADQLIQDYGKMHGLTLLELYGCGRAYCQGKHIVLPDRKQFESSYEYYGTIFHELGHVTKQMQPRNGTFNYAQEELVAEITASLLCAMFHLTDDRTERNSLAYLKNWYERIEEARPKDLYVAAAEAKRVAEQILSANPHIRAQLLPGAVWEEPKIEPPRERKELETWKRPSMGKKR